VDYDLVLDATGLSCPLPLLKMKQRLNTLSVGQVLKVLTTDPGSVRDFHAFAAQTRHDLTQLDDETGHYSFLLRKC